MKTRLILLLTLLSVTAFSQENVIKLGLSGMSYGMYSLSYERGITPKSSINLNLGYWNVNASLINYDPFEIGDEFGINKFKSGVNGAIDYRFYVGKQDGLKGLYIGPYARYWNYSAVLYDEIHSENFDINSKISSIGLGFQMGYHWIINNKISIDWYFIGLGVERLNAQLEYVPQSAGYNFNDSGKNIEVEIKDVFNDFEYLQNRVSTETVDNKNTTAKLPFFFAGIKTGFSIGYAF